MEGIVTIKEELKKQKEIIEGLEGKVNVSNLNPSPAEITAGLKTIPIVNLSDATATPADVKQGKTFYAGDSLIKTGTAIAGSEEIINSLFMYEEGVVNTDEEVYYSIPDNVKTIRKYCFCLNVNPITIYFDANLTKVDEYAFYKAANFKFVNFNDLKNISVVGSSAFSLSGAQGIDIGNLPDSITTINANGFYHCEKENMDFKFPKNITTLGQYAFTASKRTLANTLDLRGFTLKTFSPYIFMNYAFNCDFNPPSTVTLISSYLNYNGSFKNVTIPAKATIGDYSFGAATANPISDYYLQTVTFESETPLSVGRDVFAEQNLENGLKIYVPDNSVEAYKAVPYLKPYINVILPMSQKP